MAFRIDIAYLGRDPRLAPIASTLPPALGVTLTGIVDSYTVDKLFNAEDQEKIAQCLANPVVQRYEILRGEEKQAKADWMAEVGFLPGMTDNIGHTCREMIEGLLDINFAEEENVYSSRIYLLSGNPYEEKLRAFISTHWCNPLIHRFTLAADGIAVSVPKVHYKSKGIADAVELELSDEELEKLGKYGIPNADGSRRGPLGLALPYLHAIRDYFRKQGRKPNDIEIETLAQTWSEHCKHTIFASPLDEVKEGIFKHYIQRATKEIRNARGEDDICVSVFSDNAGGIIFDERWMICDKVETHNSPSALDPLSGAMTGILGVNRDVVGFGIGAKPILNRYGFCVADPESDPKLYRDEKRTQPALSPEYILKGVIEGVNVGGNCSGIPTPQGFLYIDPRYAGKPLVFAGTIGLIPRTVNGKPSHEAQALPGDYIVMVGGRVGKDGIHGATFSSVALDEESPVTAVQLGDAITQKKFSDAIVKEARDLGLYRAITDNGAGGLSSSVGEMATGSGGFKLELDKVPLKYPGMQPWEIWVSESQERMTLAVEEKNIEPLKALLAKRGSEMAVIGKFTDTGRAIITFHDTIIMDMEMEFLHDGLPKIPLSTRPVPAAPKSSSIPEPRDLGALLLEMMASPNLCSREWIATQYDHEVQASSLLKPLQGKGRVFADATVSKPVLGSPKGVVLTQAITARYSDGDAYRMAASAIDSAVRQAVAAGGKMEHLAILDNFCWCSSEEPERLAQLKDAARACYELAVAYGTPFISGKDSMFNDFKGFDASGKPIKISVPPTLLISAIGVMENASQAVSLDAKLPGDALYLLGDTKEEMGCSEYFWHLAERGNFHPTTGEVPAVDTGVAKKRYQALSAAIGENLVASSISVGLGGLGAALARKAIGGALGLKVSLASKLRKDLLLFSETQSRILVTVAPAQIAAFEKAMQGTDYARIGEVTEKPELVIEQILRCDVGALEKAYKQRFAAW